MSSMRCSIVSCDGVCCVMSYHVMSCHLHLHVEQELKLAASQLKEYRDIKVIITPCTPSQHILSHLVISPPLRRVSCHHVIISSCHHSCHHVMIHPIISYHHHPYRKKQVLLLPHYVNNSHPYNVNKNRIKKNWINIKHNQKY